MQHYWMVRENQNKQTKKKCGPFHKCCILQLVVWHILQMIVARKLQIILQNLQCYHMLMHVLQVCSLFWLFMWKWERGKLMMQIVACMLQIWWKRPQAIRLVLHCAQRAEYHVDFHHVFLMVLFLDEHMYNSCNEWMHLTALLCLLSSKTFQVFLQTKL